MKRVSLIPSLILLLAFAQTGPLSAATLTVNTNDGFATPLDGKCSLHEAITEINGGALINPDCLNTSADAIGTNDTITFAPSITGKIVLTSVLPDVIKAIHIHGPGADKLAIDGNHAVRIFRVTASTSAEILGLTLQNGKTTSQGGAITNAGSIDLGNMAISNNSAASVGGGIANEPGSSLIMINSTVSNNTSDSNCGGIYNGGNMTLSNATVSGNGAPNSGGGICSLNLLIINNSTITGNKTNTSGTGSAGGLFILGGTSQLYRTIVSGNTDGSPGKAPDCQGAITTGGNNLIGDKKGCGFTGTNGAKGDKVGDSGASSAIDAHLGPLNLNPPGTTLTHALLVGSPAIDGVSPADCGASTDQRGFSRPQGVTCDMGAYEKGCGDGVVDSDEGCDDGNTNPGEGCSATCTVETGFSCTGSPSVCTVNSAGSSGGSSSGSSTGGTTAASDASSTGTTSGCQLIR